MGSGFGVELILPSLVQVDSVGHLFPQEFSNCLVSRETVHIGTGDPLVREPR